MFAGGFAGCQLGNETPTLPCLIRQRRVDSPRPLPYGVPVSSSFDARCYALLRQIPRGRVTTYRDLAVALGSRAFRAVGQAMHRNPDAPEVPCHRVVCSDGRIGGYAGGVARKRALLKSEGIEVRGGRVVDLAKVRFVFRESRLQRGGRGSRSSADTPRS